MTTQRLSEVAETVSQDQLVALAAAPMYEPSEPDPLSEPYAIQLASNAQVVA